MSNDIKDKRFRDILDFQIGRHVNDDFITIECPKADAKNKLSVNMVKELITFLNEQVEDIENNRIVND